MFLKYIEFIIDNIENFQDKDFDFEIEKHLIYDVSEFREQNQITKIEILPLRFLQLGLISLMTAFAAFTLISEDMAYVLFLIALGTMVLSLIAKISIKLMLDSVKREFFYKEWKSFFGQNYSENEILTLFMLDEVNGKKSGRLIKRLKSLSEDKQVSHLIKLLDKFNRE